MTELKLFAVEVQDRVGIVLAQTWKEAWKFELDCWSYARVGGWLSVAIKAGLEQIPPVDGVKIRQIHSINNGAVVWSNGSVSLPPCTESLPEFGEIVHRLRPDHTYRLVELMQVLGCSELMIEALVQQGMPVTRSETLGVWFEGNSLIQWFGSMAVTQPV